MHTFLTMSLTSSLAEVERGHRLSKRQAAYICSRRPV